MSKASLATLMADLDSSIGANAENATVTQFINTGEPSLNYAISGRYDGGLPYGRMLEMFGESSSGKTALATSWMKEAQNMGGVAGFTDWERSFSEDLAREGFDLNTDRPFWLYNKAKTWEEGNTIAAKACRVIRQSGAIDKDAPILWVFDSIAAALPQSVLYDDKGNMKELDKYTMNDTTALARVTSTTLKTMAQVAEDCNATFLYLNQMRLKPGVVYGDPRTTPGGKAMEFYATARMALGRTKIMEAVKGGKEFVGQKISVQVTKSKLTKPFKEAELFMNFDEAGVAHLDMVRSSVEYAIKQGMIPKDGAMYVWQGKKYYAKALAQLITDNGQQAELNKLFAPAE